MERKLAHDRLDGRRLQTGKPAKGMLGEEDVSEASF
jgi:hypothetical protein